MSGDQIGNEPAHPAAVTREQIVAAAVDLIGRHGVGATGLAEVSAATGISRTQLAEHFADKDALVEAVVVNQAEQVLAVQDELLRPLGSMDDLRWWRDSVVAVNRAGGHGRSCPLGSLVSEVATQYEAGRLALLAGFAAWEAKLADALTRMRASGELRPEADPATLATGVMAALQGGLLLARTTRDPRRLEAALDMALSHVQAHATRL
jgi:AcrR family transcriptional regulator